MKVLRCMRNYRRVSSKSSSSSSNSSKAAARARFYPSNNVNYMIVQQPPLCDGANGSSFLSIGPHTEGTNGSFVSLQYDIKLYFYC